MKQITSANTSYQYIESQLLKDVNDFKLIYRFIAILTSIIMEFGVGS